MKQTKQIEELTEDDLIEVWRVIGGAPHLFEYWKEELKRMLIDGSLTNDEGEVIELSLNYYTIAAIAKILGSRGFNTDDESSASIHPEEPEGQEEKKWTESEVEALVEYLVPGMNSMVLISDFREITRKK